VALAVVLDVAVVSAGAGGAAVDMFCARVENIGEAVGVVVGNVDVLTDAVGTAGAVGGGGMMLARAGVLCDVLVLLEVELELVVVLGKAVVGGGLVVLLGVGLAEVDGGAGAGGAKGEKDALAHSSVHPKFELESKDPSNMPCAVTTDVVCHALMFWLKASAL